MTSPPRPAAATGSAFEVVDAQDDIFVVSGPPAPPRLFLGRAYVDDGALHGGWWPRSYDPFAELPGLILTLCARYGAIRQVGLHTAEWHRPFSRLAIDAGVVGLAWSTGLDPALMVAMTDEDKAIHLLVVAPHTAPDTAKRAMTVAADPTNTLKAEGILAATA